MAVYTPLTTTDLVKLLRNYDLGTLHHFENIAAGVKNSSFFVTTRLSNGQLANGQLANGQLANEEPAKDYVASGAYGYWVLSLLEASAADQIEFTVALTTQLHAAGLPVPSPVPDRQGKSVQRVADKPALLFPRASGSHPTLPDSLQCAAIGDFLGRMHDITVDVAGNHASETTTPGLLGGLHRADIYNALANALNRKDRALLDQQIDRGARLVGVGRDCPRGAIHADLFRDNAFFDQSGLTAVIDFHSACTDWLLWDVAIAVNDWCCDAQGIMDVVRTNALLSAYARRRPFAPVEHLLWRDVVCYSAGLFWVSRLLARSSSSTEAMLTQQKDPEEYRLKLLQRMTFTPPLPT